METTDKRQMTRKEIHVLVRGLLPVDWVHVRLLASLSPAKRVAANMRAAEFARALVKGSLKKKYPEFTNSELNMKVLEYFTGFRLPKP